MKFPCLVLSLEEYAKIRHGGLILDCVFFIFAISTPLLWSSSTSIIVSFLLHVKSDIETKGQISSKKSGLFPKINENSF